MNIHSIDYFKQELAYLREYAARFSDEYPQVAAELKISDGRSSDPHIENLLQSVAFLTGKLRQDLHAHSNDIPNQLLGNLYPHLSGSSPSMVVAKMEVLPDGASFENGFILSKDRSFYTHAIGDQGHKVKCQFNNCYDTPIWPIEVVSVSQRPINEYEFLQDHRDINALISVRIRNNSSVPIRDFPLQSLRFYIGQDRAGLSLYNLLCQHLQGVIVTQSEKVYAQKLSLQDLSWLGFLPEHAVLPMQATSHQAYRLLQEYFLFPEKFQFFELNKINPTLLEDEFEILFLFDRPLTKSMQLNESSFMLNCVPLINRFVRQIEPVRLDHEHYEYRLVGDQKNHAYCEVMELRDAKLINPAGGSERLSAFPVPELLPTSAKYFYSTRVEYSALKSVAGTETYLSLHNLDFQFDKPAQDLLAINAWCCNRRLPESLRAGDLLLLDGPGPVATAMLLQQPSRHRPPALEGDRPWQLISQLSLNHLSLNNDVSSLSSMKNILLLHADNSVPSHLKQIASLVELKTKQVAKHIGVDAWRGIAKATQVILTVEEEKAELDHPYFLFGSVLRRFISLYANCQHVTQLILYSRQRSGVWKQWLPLVGDQQEL